MNHFAKGLGVAALCISAPVWAAEDVGLTHNSRGAHAVQSGGFGATLGATIKLDRQKGGRASEHVSLNLNAGPVIKLVDAQNGAKPRFTVGSTFTLRVAPGYSSTVMLAGQPVLTHYTRAGAAEDSGENEEKEAKRKGKGPSTLGWVAIGVGSFLVVGTIVTAASLDDLFEFCEGGCK